MDLAQLNQVQAKRSKLNKQKGSQAELILKRAYLALERTQLKADPQKRKKALIDSLHHFEKALQLQRSNPECYIGLAAIHLMLDEKDEAIPYIQESERLNPKHPDIVILKEAVQNQDKEKPESPFQMTLEDRYKQLQAELFEAQAFTSQFTVASIANLEINYNELAWSFKQILKWRRELAELELEMNVLALRHSLVSFENKMNKYQEQLKHTNAMQELHDEITQLEQRCIYDLNRVNSGINPIDINQYASELEDILDHCDRIADRLNYIEEQGYIISPLEPHYDRLAQKVSLLQDSLDQC